MCAMKKIFTLFILLCAFTSCSEVSITEEHFLLTDEVKYYATITESDPASRTYLDEQRRQCWHAKDSISVFRTTRNERFNFDGDTGAFEGSFTRDESESADTSVGDAISTTYALYPCDAAATLDAEEKISLTMPAMQYYAKNSYGPSANVMVAAAESAQSDILPFRSVGGYLVVKLYGENTTIASITLAGNNGEVLAGNATAEARYGYTPSLMMAEGGSREVTIDCGEGVTLSNDKENPTEFWFVLPPVTFEKGITIMTVNSQNQMDTQSTNKKLTVSRNTAKLMAAYKPMFNGPANNELWYKSKSPDTNQFIDFYVEGYGTRVFGTNADGTESIFEYDYNPGGCCRVKHFSGEVTQLPYHIFYDKDNLEEVALPNSLRTICEGAFIACDGLKGIIIPENVYQIDAYAFRACTSLETVLIKGQLTSLGGMIFYDCTSLKIVEFAEGITRLTDRMFGNCVSLETITLPASIGQIDSQIFAGCTNLKTVYVKATTPPDMSYWVFTDNEHQNLNCKIYVPVESVEEYKKASNWLTYADQIEGYNF